MFGKTFVERRSLLTMYRTFYRVWAFLILEFHFMAVRGRLEHATHRQRMAARPRTPAPAMLSPLGLRVGLPPSQAAGRMCRRLSAHICSHLPQHSQASLPAFALHSDQPLEPTSPHCLPACCRSWCGAGTPPPAATTTRSAPWR